jgi:uncharacterized protein YcbK (DUF882 family)
MLSVEAGKNLPLHTAFAGLELQNSQLQAGCFKPALTDKLKSLETHFGRPVVVSSGYRDPAHARQVGEGEELLHTHCDAADVRIQGVSKREIADILRSLPDRFGIGT